MKDLLFITAILLSTTSSTQLLFGQDQFSSEIDPFSRPASNAQLQPATASASETAADDEEPGFFSKLKFEKKKKTAKRPNAFQKMNNSTKRLMKKSKETLMPWTVSREDGLSTGMKTKKKEKKNFFAELLKPFPDEEPPITTANDWFRQPKPTLR